MATLSVVISAFNEEAKIKACLESVLFADEIVLVDNSSTDKTAEIAKEFTSKIHKQPNNLMLNVNKNFGFTKAKNDWILCLDADERVTPELRDEIHTILREDNKSFNGYWIPRKNMIFGKWIKSAMWWPDYQLRLFRRGKGKFPEVHVHEYIRVEGETEKLKEPLIHENYSSVSQYLYKMDMIYTENEAKNLISSGKQVGWIDAIRFPADDFLKTFFLQKGYKEGLHGLVLSLLQAFYSLIVFAKVWEKQNFKEEHNENYIKDLVREIKKIGREFEYWVFTTLIEEHKNPLMKVIYRFSRKIRK